MTRKKVYAIISLAVSLRNKGLSRNEKDGCIMLRAVIFGFGNIGHAVLEALQASTDFEVAGVVSRSLEPGSLGNIPVVRDISELSDVNVAILCSPSRAVPDLAASLLEKGICTVDSYDIHSNIFEVRQRLDGVAKAHGAASVLSAGWDPGTDSMVRALLEAMAPKGITYTNFGPGMSMGHTVAVKAIPGVKNALSMTIPLGTSIHRRMVYVELEKGFAFDEVALAIKNDDYFRHDETHVMQVESVSALKDVGHGVNLVRKGVSGDTHSQRFGFTMEINNPALTGQILVAAARAVVKQAPGCYTMIELPPIDLLEGEQESLIRRLV